MCKSWLRIFVALVASVILQGAFAADPASSPARDKAVSHTQSGSTAVTSGTETGLAAVYSDRLNGHRTASGKRYNRNALTTAHKSLPFGTRVRVTNTHNHKSVELVVNDRGPRQAGRVLDISPAAAKKLGIHRRGMAEVTVEVIGNA